MPLPPPSFTKSKWLAFFAELTAKLTHHNLLVVIEGCETVKRLLMSRVSIAAFLQEGCLLQGLMDTIVGGIRSERLLGPSVALNEELSWTQLETLSLCIDLMVSLHADEDPYYCLLVQARAGCFVEGLLDVLRRAHPHLYGVAANLLLTLLRLPLGRRNFAEVGATSSESVALRRHIEELKSLVGRHPMILQEVMDTTAAIIATTDGPDRFAAMKLLNVASQRLAKAKRHAALRGEEHEAHPPESCATSESRAMEHTLGNSFQSTGSTLEVDLTITGARPPKPVLPTPSATEAAQDKAEDISAVVDAEPPHTTFTVPDLLFTAAFEKISTCTCHEHFFDGMNALWGLTVADSAGVAERFTAEQFKHMSRFLRTVPATRQDRVLFTSLLLWVGHMMATRRIPDPTRDAILDVAGGSLFGMILAESNKKDLRNCASDATDAPTDFTQERGVSREDSHVQPFSVIRKREEAAMMATPSVVLVVFSFLLNVGPACSSTQLDHWIRDGGALTIVERVIRRVEHVKSALIDSPTTMDGALSDEVYLNCAMNSVRSDDTVLAILGCKLLASILWTHASFLTQFLAMEIAPFLQTVVPLLMHISLHNPTVASARENLSASALHHSPSNVRSSRYTSLGECSIAALDGALSFLRESHLECICLTDVLPALPSLARCTRGSIHPPLRATVYRALCYLCKTPADLLTVSQEMPSAINAAVVSVLEYTASSPQWEAASAAEWLRVVIEVASTDAKVEQAIHFTKTTLPIKLLELVAQVPVCYATSALLSLCVALFQQQRRLAEQQQEVSTNVLAPYGRRSLQAWHTIVQGITLSNQKLASLGRSVLSPLAPTASKDAHSRALSSVESIAVQYTQTCATAQSLCYLFTHFPEHREHFTHHMMYSFLGGAFATPTPRRIFGLLSARFGATVEYHPTLLHTHEAMMEASCELGALWFNAPLHAPSTAVEFPSTPTTFFADVVQLMGDASVAKRTRCHLSLLMSSILLLPGTSAPVEDMRSSSAELFEASLTLPQITSTAGMQCRVLRQFEPAARQAALETPWLMSRIHQLELVLRVLHENDGVLTPKDKESFTVALSLVSSLLSNQQCPTLPAKTLQPLGAVLCECLRYDATRWPTMMALKVMATSAEGQRCLLHEMCAAGEPLARSCFGRVLALTLQIPTVWVQQQEKVQRSARPTPKPAAPPSKAEAMRHKVVEAGMDICISSCGHEGGHPFVAALLKHKGLEHMAQHIKDYDAKQQHHSLDGCAIPLQLLRLLAATSFDAEGQRAIFAQSTIVTILIEVAGYATSEGSLALLLLRNLCFNPNLKRLLCQDTRLLLTLKAALMGRQSVESLVLPEDVPINISPAPSSVGGSAASVAVKAAPPILLRASFDGHNESTMDWAKKVALASHRRLMQQHTTEPGMKRSTQAADGGRGGAGLLTLRSLKEGHTHRVADHAAPSPETFVRQELAAYAVWALMYDHQKGKSQVRAVMLQAPAVSLAHLTSSRSAMEQMMHPASSASTEAEPSSHATSSLSRAIEELQFLSKGQF